MIERTLRMGMAGMTNGMNDAIFIPGAKTKARRAIEQSAVCAACRGGCHSHQSEGVPVGMNFGRVSAKK